MDKAELVKKAKEITKKHGKNYYRAASLFPKEVRDDTYVYYAWVRIPDDYVDALNQKKENERKFRDWLREWEEIKLGNSKVNYFHKAKCELIKKYSIPTEYADSFLEAMNNDLEKDRYETYEELERYMYGSASVVGLTMISIFGLHNDTYMYGAKKLGEAMQLANFIRDIREDIDELGRIYIPKEDLDTFNVTYDDIVNHSHDTHFINLMTFEVNRCEMLFEEALKYINILPWKLKFPVRVATRNYQEVLQEIKKNNYNIWNKKHSATTFRKKLIIIKSIFL